MKNMCLTKKTKKSFQRHFNSNGVLKNERTMKKGKRITEKEWDDSGKLVQLKTFDKKGKLIMKKNY